ncbi:EamA-like transporter family protein [Pacificibacter maritimus]|uniref:EamA-like transporter family protein n=1 Tax=Pacificibacter maritimus TaxID=762213 RepID=A0A3N4V2Q4_9RHOB|nr:DMT family transporter [Pacificibacter maritimus]RPE71377.1 EamA-like transporter family protein [Pacificibacter maritimus]
MAPQKVLTRSAWIGLATMGIFWGGSFLSIELMLRQMPVETLVALRVSGGALALWAYVFIRGFKIPKGARIWISFLLIGLINVAMPFGLITWGQQYIPSGLAGILNAFTAVLGPVVAALIFADERLGLRKAVGVLCGFFGVATVIGLDAFHSFDLTSAGQLALLGSCLCYAIGAAMARMHLTGIRLEISAAGMISGAAVWMIPVAIYMHGLPDFASFTPTTLGAWAYVSLISTGLAYLILFSVIKSAGSGNATLCTLVVAPVSVVLGAIVLGEALPLAAYIGFIFIACGLLIIDGRLLRMAKARF